MASTKISALTDGVTANATDDIGAARSGGNVRIQPGYIRTYLLGLANTWTATQTFSANVQQQTTSDSTTAWFVKNNAGNIIAAVDTATRYFLAGDSAFAVSVASGATSIYDAGNFGWTASGTAQASLDTSLLRESAGIIGSPGSLRVMRATAIPAGGTPGAGYKFSSTANFGVFFGSGAPSLAAAKGSLYLRSDGSGIADRVYVNTDGSTTWTNLVTAA